MVKRETSISFVGQILQNIIYNFQLETQQTTSKSQNLTIIMLNAHKFQVLLQLPNKEEIKTILIYFQHENKNSKTLICLLHMAITDHFT